MSKKKCPSKLQTWIDARRRLHLSDMHIQMAKELGLNPKKLGKLGNHKQQPWKLPLPHFIEELYYDRFSKSEPNQIKTIRQIFELERKNKSKDTITAP